jgi:class 3 adenylate cyclase
MCDMACAGEIDIATAQQAFATDWIAAYQRHFQHLLDITVRHNGAVTIGDAVMAAFETPADAVRAAFDMREAVDQAGGSGMWPE